MLLKPMGLMRAVVAGGDRAATFTGSLFQDNGSAGIATFTSSATLTLSAGDLVVMLLSWNRNDELDPNFTSVTCGGTAMTYADSQIVDTTEHWRARLYYLANASANASAAISVTCDNTISWSACLAANYAGVATSSPLGQVACNTSGCAGLSSSSTNRTTQNITTTVADSLLIAIGHEWNGTTTLTAANGYTKRAGGTNGTTHWLFDKSVNATGTYPNGHFATSNSADTYLGFSASFALA